MLFFTYSLLLTVCKPYLNRVIEKRLESGKEDPLRLGERKGMASVSRPNGDIIWIHTASVGEALSALPLIDFLLENYGTYNILITSGTITSANLLSERLPKNVIHQYVPIDHKPWVQHFINYWNPKLALFVESELWPNIINELSLNNIPIGLINARLSDNSFKKWKSYSLLTKSLFIKLSFVIAQSEEYSDKYAKLGVKNTYHSGNLKFLSPALPVDQEFLQQLEKETQQTHPRSIWVACSTHENEEIMASKIHTSLAETHKNLLTIIVPRHPNRSQDIQDCLKSLGYNIACRSKNESIKEDTQIYLLDTLGEMGTVLQLSSIAYIGKSLLNHGGHNPLEPAKLGCAVIFGNHMENFEDIKKDMLANTSAIEVTSQEELTLIIDKLLTNEAYKNLQITNATAYANSQKDSLDQINNVIKNYLNR